MYGRGRRTEALGTEAGELEPGAGKRVVAQHTPTGNPCAALPPAPLRGAHKLPLTRTGHHFFSTAFMTPLPDTGGVPE